MRFKQSVSVEMANLVYNGFWFSAHTQDLMSYVLSTQRYVTGTIRMKLFKGIAAAVGRKADNSLYNEALATYGKGDLFDHNAALGFISLVGLPMRNQAEKQLLLGTSADDLMRRLAAPASEANAGSHGGGERRTDGGTGR
jgi:argininosuccinate synthase